MSSNAQGFNNGQQLQVNTNLAKLFPFEKEFAKYSYTNSTYDTVTLSAGTVMGVVAATGLVKPMTSGASDGSQYPIGILGQDYSVEGGDTVNVFVMVKGYVRKDMILLQGSDELETVVSGKRIYERIGSDSVGVFIQTTESATNYDNQL